MTLVRIRTLAAGLVLGLALQPGLVISASSQANQYNPYFIWRKAHVQKLQTMNVDEFAKYLENDPCKSSYPEDYIGGDSFRANIGRLRDDERVIHEELGKTLDEDMQCKFEMLELRRAILDFEKRIERCKKLKPLASQEFCDSKTRGESWECDADEKDVSTWLARANSEFARHKEGCKAKNQAKKEQAAQ